MEELEIKDALEGRLLTLADRPPTVWPNEADTGVRPRLEVQIFRNTAQAAAFGHLYRLLGIFQVTVVTQVGVFERDALTIAGRIAAHFPAGLILSGVEIYSRPTIEAGFVDPNGAEYRIPVSIPFQAYVKET